MWKFILEDERAGKDIERKGKEYIDKETLQEILGKMRGTAKMGLKDVEKYMDGSLMQKRYQTLENGIGDGVRYNMDSNSVFMKQLVSAKEASISYDFAKNTLSKITDDIGVKQFYDGIDMDILFPTKEIPPTWDEMDLGLDKAQKAAIIEQLHNQKKVENILNRKLKTATKLEKKLSSKLGTIENKTVTEVAKQDKKVFNRELQSDIFNERELDRIGTKGVKLTKQLDNLKAKRVMAEMKNDWIDMQDEDTLMLGLEDQINEDMGSLGDIPKMGTTGTNAKRIDLSSIDEKIKSLETKIKELKPRSLKVGEMGKTKTIENLGILKTTTEIESKTALQQLADITNQVAELETEKSRLNSSLTEIKRMTTFYGPKESIAIVKGYNENMMKDDAAKDLLS